MFVSRDVGFSEDLMDKLNLFNVTELYSFTSLSICSFLFIFQLTITLTKEDSGSGGLHNVYCYAGGLVEYVTWLNTDKVCACLIVHFILVCGIELTLGLLTEAAPSTCILQKRGRWNYSRRGSSMVNKKSCNYWYA